MVNDRLTLFGRQPRQWGVQIAVHTQTSAVGNGSADILRHFYVTGLCLVETKKTRQNASMGRTSPDGSEAEMEMGY